MASTGWFDRWKERYGGKAAQCLWPKIISKSEKFLKFIAKFHSYQQ
jgi:hypothetical protein